MKLKAEISNRIQEITEDCYKSNGGVNVFKLLKKLNIKCWVSNMSDVLGAIVKEKDKFEIFVNKIDSPKRQRLIICHELGHYISHICYSFSRQEFDKNGFIEDTYSVLGRTDIIKSDVEIEANQIAAEILMPENKFKELVNRAYSIEELADYFECVSPLVRSRAKSLSLNIENNYFILS